MCTLYLTLLCCTFYCSLCNYISSFTPQGPRYMALYDYAAADEDEVSFSEGDVIIEANVIDEGWMEGRVERTGQFGMLPSNYVEKM